MSNNIETVQNDDVTTAGQFLVFASAVPGRLDEMRRWYDDEHIPEILATHAFVRSVQRHDVSATVPHPAGADAEAFDSIAVYTVEGSPRAAWDAIRSGPPLGRTDTLDYAAMRVLFIGE